MIPQKQVQEVIERAKIEDIVGDYVTLKRRGVNLIGLCPFHNEKSPSFTVSPAKNICTCFGCGKGGDPVEFIKQKEDLNFIDAIKYLAKKYSIKIQQRELTSKEVQLHKQKESMFIANSFAMNFYQSFANQQKAYFESRGFTKETIEKWGLGYAPTNVKHLFGEATRKGHTIKVFKELGLINERDNDKLRGRITFPIRHYQSGKIAGFTARIIGEKTNQLAKYINSPDSVIYNKKKVLYGLHFAKSAIVQKDECILVEGNTDVISLHQNGIKNVVATSGTALTIQQIKLIKKYTDNITVLYDGDKAGIKATLKAIDGLLAEDMNIGIFTLAADQDPDTFIREVGTASFIEHLKKESQDFILYKIGQVQHIEKEPVVKAKLTKEILSSINLIPDNLKRRNYLDIAAKLLTLPTDLLHNESEEMIARKEAKAMKVLANQRGRVAAPSLDFLEDGELPNLADALKLEADFLERDLIDLVLAIGEQKYPDNIGITVGQYICHNLKKHLKYFKNERYKLIIEEYLIRSKNKEGETIAYFLNHPDLKIQKMAIAAKDVAFQDIKKAIHDAVFRFFLFIYNQNYILAKGEFHLVESGNSLNSIDYLKATVNAIEIQRNQLIDKLS